MRKIALVLCAVLLTELPLAFTSAAAADGSKQPVFLICPYKEKYSAWSLYVIPDKSNPAKIATLGLEKLSKLNSKDEDYEDVVKAQFDSKTAREDLGTLDAKEFGSGKIEVKKDDALKVSISESGADYKLFVSMRIAADLRFEMGGKEEKKRDLILHFDKDKKKWSAYVSHLEDTEKKAVVKGEMKEISGIQFPVTGTGIYEVYAQVDGLGRVFVYDRGGMPDDH
jgi:hypothetical protein